MTNSIQLLHGRGSFAETIMRNTIIWYEQEKIALIHQTLPEWTKQQLRVRGHRSVQCDYVGLFAGYYVEFEVKETNQTKFWLRNIRPQQWRRLVTVNEHGGLGFLILCFSEQQQFFLIPFAAIKKERDRKFLDYQTLTKAGWEVNLTKRLTLDLSAKIIVATENLNTKQKPNA